MTENKEIEIGLPSIGIPAEVLFNPKLTQSEKILFGFFRNLSKSKRGCWATNEYLGNLTNLGKQTISNSIANLHKFEYISIKRFKNKQGEQERNIFINSKYQEKYKPLVEITHERLYKKIYIPLKENLYTPIKKIINNNEKDINSISNKKTIINDRNGFANKSKKIPVKLKRIDLHSLRLIQYWIDLGYTTKHNISKPYNKSCLQMIKYLSDLQKGSFAINRKFNSEWIKKENIPENWFTKAWMPMELRNGLKQASKYALEGYWPENNKSNFKSLSYILYNDFGDKKRSWLFTAMKNPPQTIKESFQKILLESTVNKFIQNPIWPKGYEFDKYRLGKGLTELKEFSDNLIHDRYNRSNEYFGSLAKLLKEYVAWIDEQDWIEIKENIIGIGNKVFRLFIEAQEKELEIKIKSKGWK